MNRILTFLLLILTIQLVCAQSHFVKKWDKRFGGDKGDSFVSFEQSDDGGYILGGFTRSGISGDKTQNSWDTNVNYADFWVIKIDSAGNKQWDKRFGGTGHDDLFTLRKTSDGGYILGGPASSGVNGDKTQANWGGADYWIVKIDSVGNKQWDRRYGGTSSESLNVVLQTKDKGYILGGYSNSPVSGDKTQDNWDVSHFYDDIWIVKIDSAGNKQWDKRYGGTNQDGIYRIIQTESGDYLLSGASMSGVNGDKTQTNWGGSDLWIVLIDSLGNKKWDKRYGGTNDEAGTILLSVNGGYLLGSTSLSGISGDKTESKTGFWLVAIDTLGNKLWDRSYSDAYDMRGLSKTLDNGYLMSGRSTSNAGGDKTENNLAPTQIWIVKTDSVGTKQWDKTIFTTKYCEGYAIQTTDGCYAVGAYTASGIGGYKTQTNWDNTEATYDYWIMKFCMDTVTDLSPALEGEGGIQVYPNPFSTDLSIALNGENIHEATFSITNAVGQTIYRKEENNLATGYTKGLDLSYLPNGIYFLEVTINGERTFKQIVKQ